MLQMTATMARKTALKRFIRFAGIISLDAGAVALSFFLAFDLRLQGALPAALKEALPVALPVVIILSLIAFYSAGLYHRAALCVDRGPVFSDGSSHARRRGIFRPADRKSTRLNSSP